MWALLALVVATVSARGEDVFDVPALEGRLDEALEELAGFPDPLFPDELEREAIEALRALGRLHEESAAQRARRALAIASSSPLAWEARKTLASAGDLETIRSALLDYFDDRDRFRDVLARSDDPRLVGFRGDAADEPALSRDRFLSSLEWNLSRARSRAAVRTLVLWAEASTGVESPRRVLAAMDKGTPYDLRIERWLARHPPQEIPAGTLPIDFEAPVLEIHDAVLAMPEREKLRALRLLAERDHAALVGLPMSGAEVDRFHPYLARSQRAAVRGRVARAVTERGHALASLVLSESAPPEEKRAMVAAMKDAWAEALSIPARGLAEAFVSLAGEAAIESFMSETADVEALAALARPEARERLAAIGSAEAIVGLMKRSDRIAAVPFLDRARRSPKASAARAADLALVSLGAPGASAFLRRELALRTPAEDLLATLSRAPLDPDLALDVLEKASPSPARVAALVSFESRYPAPFLSWASALDGSDARLRDHAHFALSLSTNARRIPLLVDLAVGGTDVSGAGREAAFAALAETDLGPFAARLHRLAGDSDRSVRFRAAAALVPSGEAFALRLLLAELDASSSSERRTARRAVARLPPERARALLEEMIRDQTAGSFGGLLFLEHGGEGSDRELWSMVKDEAEAGDETALLVASQLETAEAIACVTRLVSARRAVR